MNFNQNCTSNILFLNSWVLMISLKKKEEEDLLPFFFVRAFLPKDINFPNLMQIYMHGRTF